MKNIKTSLLCVWKRLHKGQDCVALPLTRAAVGREGEEHVTRDDKLHYPQSNGGC